jgi:transcriptional regulator with GAF, ATPase, and Fis domain/CHASE2 domain-containing sensor protein
MTSFLKKQIFIGCIAVLCTIIIAIPVSSLFYSLDGIVQNLMTHLRGESGIDSSIAIVYFNNDDIESLGGYPLKRSYYALLIKTLQELQVSAIGIDVGFSQPDERYPEYDNLLGSVVEGCPNIVMGGYFRRIDAVADTETVDTNLSPFLFTAIGNENWLIGKEPHFPFLSLRHKSNSLGYTNFLEDTSIPVVVKYGNGYMAAFGFELLRHGLRTLKSSVYALNNEIFLKNNIRNVNIPLRKNGSAELNFAGGKKALNLYRAVDVMKMYDEVAAGEFEGNAKGTWKGKFVLVGIIAEGRSTFIDSPFGHDFPSVGVHAMFIHNALHGNFITRMPYSYVYGISIIFGIISVILFSLRPPWLRILFVSCIVLGLVVISYFLFVLNSFIIPIALPVLTILTVGITVEIYKHRYIRKEVEVLTREKGRIEETLRLKESKLALLENELIKIKDTRTESDQVRLEAEIEQYKQEINRLREEAGDLQTGVSEESINAGEKCEMEGIVYAAGGPMEEVINMVRTVAESDATVLLLGESGTGKELVARALHNTSYRKEHAFVAVNCGALTETLLESELFGHEKGAFTGATREREGRFDIADKGTIFLDEIGDTSEAFQVKLLRVLQDGTFERVGGNHMRQVDVRVIAATNRDLHKAVKEKSFREDLYYRLNVISIEIPPLRERKTDLPLLVEHFLNLEDPRMTFSVSVMEAFRQHPWRGNVRELHSVIKRAVLLSRADGRTMLRVKDLPGILSTKQGSSDDLEEQIISALREKKFSRSAISETADLLGGLNRGTVAEYFRGYCFKTICESGMNLKAAVEKVTDMTDANVNMKVERKLREYVKNAAELVDRSIPLEDVLLRSKPKYKNLPQRYHSHLDQIITSAYEDKIVL